MRHGLNVKIKLMDFQVQYIKGLQQKKKHWLLLVKIAEGRKIWKKPRLSHMLMEVMIR